MAIIQGRKRGEKTWVTLGTGYTSRSDASDALRPYKTNKKSGWNSDDSYKVLDKEPVKLKDKWF